MGFFYIKGAAWKNGPEKGGDRAAKGFLDGRNLWPAAKPD